MQSLIRLAAIGFMALLAGCAGGGTRSVPSTLGTYAAASAGPGDTTAAGFAAEPDAGKSRLTLKITIPAPSRKDFHGTVAAQKGARGYVSPGSKGMTLLWSGKSSGTKAFDLTSNNKNCKGNPLVCKIALPLDPGKYKTDVNLYDLAPVDGKIPDNAHLLSTASNVAFSIKKGKSTGISPKLEGVEGSLSIGPLPNQCAGVAFGPTPFTVTALDADGYTIGGTYATEITLSDSDTSGATAIATSGSDNPPTDTLLSSSDVATLAWNGNSIPGGEATIDANAGKYVFTSAQFTPQVTKGFKLLSYTGGSQNFTVPVCATTMYVIVAGAQGGGPFSNNPGGYGGEVGATIPTTPGESLAIYIGGAGGNGTYSTQGYGGFNGGAAGAPPELSKAFGGGNGGGGASDARQGGTALANRVVVAGGGGGSGYAGSISSFGGPGGGLTGGSGQDGYCLGLMGKGGGGGTQTSGGAGGAGNNDGTLGSGGIGFGYCGSSTGGIGFGSGGGGGGYYGGGGANGGAGGGGGSGFAEASATNVTMNTGAEFGDGFATLCWGNSNNKCGANDALRKKHRNPSGPHATLSH